MSDEAVLIPGQVAEKFLLHAQSPRNLGAVALANGSAEMTGQCGDSVTVTIRVDDERISDIGVIHRGCVYTVVCASALSELAKGRTLDSALQLNPEDVAHELGGLPEDHLHCARWGVNTRGEAVSDYYFRMTGSGLPAVALREGRRADDVSP